MPASDMPGSSLAQYPYYFAGVRGLLGQKMGVGPVGSGGLRGLPLNSWSVGRFDNYGDQSTSPWLLGENIKPGHPPPNPIRQFPPVLQGWRDGDWICRCGFHNYSSRSQCKKCNAVMSSLPSALGMKRLASEDLIGELDNKRLNAGQTTMYLQSYRSFDQGAGSSTDQRSGVDPFFQLPVQLCRQICKSRLHINRLQLYPGKEQHSGGMVIGCAQIAATITTNPEQSAIDVRLRNPKS